MSQSEGQSTACSLCSKPKQKYDVYTLKCSRHSYKLCNICNRKEKGNPCPDCESEKTTEGKNGNHINQEYLKNQKDMEVKNILIEMYKVKEESSNKIEALKASQEKTINELKANYEKQALIENERKEKEFSQKIEVLSKQRDELNKKIQTQKAEMLKISELQKNLMKTNFQNEKQALLLESQTKKREDYERNEKKEKDMKQRYEDQIKNLRNSYDQEIKQFKTKLETQRAELTQRHQLEKSNGQKKYETQRKELESRLTAEKNQIIQRYEAEKEMERGSFIQQKSGLEELVELKASEYQAIIQKQNEDKKRLQQEIEEREKQFKSQNSNDERVITEKNMEISRLANENEKLNNYIATHDKSLDYYKKEIDDFDQYIERNNRHIIAQFKSLDDTYAEPTPQKIKQTQLLVKQYKEVVSTTQHPLLNKIISDKQSMVSSYVAGEMKNFGPSIEDLDFKDIFYIHSEKGKKFKRVIEKIDLIRSLDNRNINDSIDLYFLPKLHQKIKEIILKCNDKIVEYNNDMSEFDLIRSIDQYEEMKDYLNAEFKDHRDVCANQYKTADDSVRAAFDRFKDNFSRIKEDKPVQKLEEYLNKAENLKKFIQITHHAKQYKKYTYYLENHLSTKMESVNKAVIIVLNQNKKKLREKLQVLMKSREYFDCYLYQKIFKKLKVFDQILTKEENSLYNFNFSELYNKILNFLKILKEEKLNLIDVIVTEEKINVDQLETEYEKVTFDESVRNRYLYKIKTVLQNRTVEFNKINTNTIITDKHLEHFQTYLVEALQLQEIKQINDLPQITEQVRAIQQKLPIVISYLEAKFKEYYLKSCEYKELEENNLVIRHHLQFETFIQNYFKADHDKFKANILASKNKDLPEPENQSECVFKLLLSLNSNHQKILDDLVNNPDEPFREEYFEFHTNMVTYTPKLSANKIQKKLEKNILQSISQLEAKEWSEGEVNSIPERKLMQRLNKLQNKEIAYYRELTNIHKNKVIDERQRLINSEKRKLKEDDFENLSSFISQCQKHEQSKSKFYKLYINILDQYTTYSYDNISNDNDKKCAFLSKLYKLNLSSDFKGPSEIFKSKEHKIYFCRPQLELVRGNIELIEKFEGDNETIVNKVTQSLVNAYKLYSIFRKNQDKSLLDQKERKKFHDEIDGIKSDVVNNFQNLCKNLDHQNIFDEKCNRKKLFLQLVKIEIYSKLMKKFQDINPNHQYYTIKGTYEEIIKRINTKIQKTFEEVKQFKFYKDQLKLQYDNNQFLYEHLRKIERIVEVFKDVKFKLYKYQSYLKNNYLEDLKLKDINYKEIIRIIEMAWIKEYTVIKKEITEMFHNQQMDIVLKYKMILHEKEIVKNQNLMSFNEIIKEEYDFKKIVIHQLLEIEEKMERNVQNLEKQYETFSFNMKKMEEKKKIYIDTTKDAIKTKYDKLIEEVKNSFHEIEDETLRQQKIEAQLNTLINQARAQEENILNQQVAKTQFFRKKFNIRAQNIVYKIFENFLMVKKVESNFDIEIEELCKKIIAKIQYDIDKYDKNIKNVFVNYVKKSNNSDLKMGATSMNIFKQVNEEQFRLNTMAMNDIHEIIKKCPQIKEDERFTKDLISAYEEYRDELQRVQGQYIESKSQNNVIQLIKDTKAQAKELSPSIIIARIFAVYSIYRCIDAHQEQTSFDGNPHISQVVAILLLIDAYHHKDAKLGNRLIEVKTGEGKSRVLGGLNCYLALLGFDVYCGCYSSYLSKRDQQEFKSLFVRFGVNNMISYGPFSEHCESVFNEADKHNFKQVTKKVLLNEKLSKMQLEYLERLNKLLKRQSRVNRILVIDQVDVFFDEHYFGQLYTPGVAIDAPEVKKLMQYIWANHNDKKLNKLTFQCTQYQALIDLYPHLTQLLKNQVESMIHACNNYNIHPYQIRNNEIQYVDNDTVNAKLNFGYSTAFAACFEYERGKISEENYNKNTNISLIIGQFSYAELPKYFDHIMGVSGTVEAMSDFRKKIMRQDYQITEIFALPSIYGDSHREIFGFHACKEKQYLEFLLNRINDVRKQRRPILVFFETEDKLNMISNSPQFNQFTTNIYKITEKMPPQMRNPLINYAGTQNRITLISSAFSRGTDFTVYDSQINEKGGMHVIQTYISKNESDFIQIMGRTGRQGKKGTFEMIVTESDLENNSIRLSDGQELFKQIKNSWKSRDFNYGQQLAKSIQHARRQHEKTFEVVSTLNKENQKLVSAVTKLNFNEIKNETIRTVIAIDGTGSMGAALNAVLTILNDTISRTEQIINMRIPNVSFEHKIMIYRNYNIKPFERILQQSDFSKDPGYLQAFMTSIKPEGGLGNEAHEILFYDIGKICEFENVDQIIIIGDAPANKYEEMTKHRKKFHGEAVWTKKYPLLPSIQKYSEVVVRQNIPVHSFFILRRKQEEQAIKWDNSVKQYFEELSRKSKGLSDQLNIRDQEKARTQLTDFISERVLDLIGGRDLVELYAKMYSKRYV